MREPVFTETMQLGIVVRDLDASLRRYVEDYGIGPWEVHHFDPENAEDLHEYGQPVGRSWRGALHHIAVSTPNFDEAVAEQAERGNDLVLSGTFGGVKLAYLPTDRGPSG